MKSSEPLSPAARRLLELGSQVDPPTAEQAERMDRALEPLFRAGRATPPPASGSPAGGWDQRATPSGNSGFRAARRVPPSPPSLQHLFGLGGGKLVLALGALAATAVASFWLGRVSTPGEPSPHTAGMPAAASALAAAVTLPAAFEASSPASAGSSARDAAALAPAAGPLQLATSVPPAASVSVSSQARSHAAPAAQDARSTLERQRPSPGLAAEVEQLARAEAALRQGRAERALSHLERLVIVHLSEQAAALRAIAECELGLASAARGARSVLQRWPISAFQARVRDACRL